ncbi:MAG: hypothetical protein C0397_19715, partial [Odoribacter sp.]|nr:hypothetical protein [Odoribacter sp.]
MYNLIYITNLPSFYKINLFNRIGKHRKLLVVFTHEKSVQRNADFYKGEREFEFISIANKSTIGKIGFIFNLLKNKPYQHLIIAGWDQLVLWLAAFISPRNKNGVVVESSILESKTTGIRGLVKKIFLSHISKAYVSGKSQADLCTALGFKDQLIITKGVGIFNIKPQPNFKASTSVKNFIYVGRLSPEKNLLFLIETFNLFPELILNVVGFGPQEIFLKSIAKQNIIFHGAVPNNELYKFYLQNDVFVLPSTSETWGMVVEEAFNNGLPVIVSDKVGCAEEIINDSNGIIFKLSEP